MLPTRTGDQVRAASIGATCLVALLAGGCSTFDLERAMYEAGQQYRCQQWQLEESGVPVDWPRASFDAYQAARDVRLDTPG